MKSAIIARATRRRCTLQPAAARAALHMGATSGPGLYGTLFGRAFRPSCFASTTRPRGEGQATARPTPHNGQRTTRRSRARTRARGRRKVEANAEPEGPATHIHREHPSIYARGSPLSRAASVRPGALNLSSVKKNAGARSRAAFPFAGFGADCGARCSGLSSPARLAARPDTRAAPAARRARPR